MIGLCRAVETRREEYRSALSDSPPSNRAGVSPTSMPFLSKTLVTYQSTTFQPSKLGLLEGGSPVLHEVNDIHQHQTAKPDSPNFYTMIY